MKRTYSIKTQYILVTVGILSIALVMIYIFNAVFLDKYYRHNRVNALKKAYEDLTNTGLDKESFTEELSIEIQRFCEKYDVSMIILDEESQTLLSSSNEPEDMVRGFWRELLTQGKEEDVELIEKNSAYTIQIVLDERTQTRYLEMLGVLGEGKLFMMRSAMTSMEESAQVANRFLLYVGAAVLLIGIVISISASARITRPIDKLTKLSESMARLNFEDKYISTNSMPPKEIESLGENMNHLSNTLEKTISQLKTANNELQKDIETRDKNDEMRREFLSNVSHELKTPISLIQGYAEAISEGISDDKETNDYYINVISDEAAKMGTLVGKLLNLNQLEFGMDIAKLTRFDIVELIKGHLQEVSALAANKGVELIFNEEQPIFVWADSFLTDEVFNNYLSNAFHYVKPDSNNHRYIEIKLDTLMADNSEEKVRVWVFNTGESIPEDSLPHLFEKFYKVDVARSRDYGGSGIGLSIVKASMDAMHGEYGVENQKDGVTFYFELVKG